MEHIDSLLQNIWNEFEEAFYIYRVKAKDSYAAITAYGEILNKYATQNTLDDALKKDVKSLTSTYISDATRMSISPQDSQDAKRGKIDLARIDFEEALKSAESPL
ncbi:MAG: hypothetical protein NT001_04485, partial [Candidatus Woesearchaeota archaeon]|nr:hypothetical protein [Candidatus Woesearchaeota archaeon]